MGMSPVSELLVRSSSLGRSQIPPWVVELRPHHWLKNILVIVPLAAAHQLQDVPSLARVAAALKHEKIWPCSHATRNSVLVELEISRGLFQDRFERRKETVMTRTVAEVMGDVLISAGARRCYGVPSDTLNYFTDAVRRSTLR